MLIKVFTLRFSNTIDGFDDENLRIFMADKNVISVREHFFIKDGLPYWAVMLVYDPEPALNEVESTPPTHKEKKEDYRSMLNSMNMPLFNLMREWRRGRALKEGVPQYILFTNRQLAEIVSMSPRSLNQLSTIEGIGKAKLDRYGNDVLRIIQNFLNKAEKSVQSRDPDRKSEEGNKKHS